MILNAGVFKPKQFTARKEFEFILIQITKCYKLMLDDCTSIKNNENTIRNYLHKNYLDNHEIIERLNLRPYFFDIETPSLNDDYKETGRTDIKVYNAIERFLVKPLERLNGGRGRLDVQHRVSHLEESLRELLLIRLIVQVEHADNAR